MKWVNLLPLTEGETITSILPLPEDARADVPPIGIGSGGKLIRCPVDDVRIAGRSVQGVRIFKTEEDEKVISVERIPEEGNGSSDRQSRRRPGLVIGCKKK